MPAVDALYARSIAMDDIESSSTMERFLDGLVESLKNPELGASVLTERTTPEEFQTLLWGMLRFSEAYWVSADMMALAVAATEAMPDDAAIDRHLLPSDIGWLLLADPITVLDVRGKVLRFNAVSWAAKSEDSFAIVWWTNKHDPVDSVNITMRKRLTDRQYARLPTYQPVHIGSVVYNRPLPQSITFGKNRVIPPDQEVSVTQGPDGSLTWVFPEGMDGEDLVPRKTPDPALQTLTVIWRLMRQTVVDLRESDEKIPRNLRRMIAKQNTSDRVSVITLRKHVRGRDQGRTVEWSHRFLRRGHWRHQWYGSNAKGNRRQEWVWVHPAIVNAAHEDLPFLVRDHVSALIR